MDCIGLLASPVIEIMKCSCPPILQRIGYVKNLKKNFGRLEEEAKSLQDKEEDVRHEIDRHGARKIPTSECRSWLNSVDQILGQVNEIKEEYNKRDMRCLKRCCLDIPSNWKLGRRVVVTMNRILDLRVKHDSMGDKLVDALPQIVEPIPTTEIEDGTSTQSTLQKILECLRNQRIQKIGIWGMGGVGKTTIMMNLNNLPELIEEKFQFVIWVTVAKDHNIRKLQTRIADRLSLKLLDGESNESVARTLSQRLGTQRFLLLLDDVWETVDLDAVGIPRPNQDNGCKVVFTTRHLDVCRKMETDRDIRVEPLSEEEAWKLFCEKVGAVVDSRDIKPLARRVVDECGGLPLAIVAVGNSLKNEGNIHMWHYALKELSSPERSDFHDMEQQVFTCLRFSFDRLKDDTIRNCFLYAALYPEDYEINILELIEYWGAEGLINPRSSSADVGNKGHAILKLLIDASLLLQSNWSIYFVKMHDVVRDLALKITSPIGSDSFGCRFLVRCNKKTEEPQENEEWERVSRISLMQNGICNNILPERPNCPTLLTLLVQMNKRLETIPESFFQHMHALRVLDLSETMISLLPTSICNLVNLRGLLLKRCYVLRTLPPQLGELKKLEVLDADQTRLATLPVEIGRLTRLIVLQVGLYGEHDDVKDVNVSGTISSLSKLERLKIIPNGSFADARFTFAREVIEDVSVLKRLMGLEISFPEVTYLERFIERSHPWKEERFTEFNFKVGHFPASSFGMNFGKESGNRILQFGWSDIVPDAIVEVLRHANVFNLIGHKKIHSINEFGMQNMSQLISCSTRECDEIKIFMEGHLLVEAALPNLEVLNIFGMRNLRSIWEGSFAPGTLNCLRILELTYCNELKNIFSRGIVHHLSNLEELSVKYCSTLEELFCEDAIVVGSEFSLPKLKVLEVHMLPGLVRILKDHVLAWPSLEEIEVWNCPNLKKLPCSTNNAPKLRRISCDRKWWKELEWDDNAIKLQLEPLCNRTLG